MSAGKAANIIRILSDKTNRDPRFLEWVTEKIVRGDNACQKPKTTSLGICEQGPSVG
jgi:hypothetical protein